MRHGALALLAVLLPLLADVRDARAQDSLSPTAEDRDGIAWRPKRGIHVTTGDTVLTIGAAGTALANAIVTPLEKHPRGGVLVDEDVRDAIRMDSREFRFAVRDMSDVGVSLAATWPFLVDALLTTWWYRGDPGLARDMAVVSAETFSLMAAFQGITSNIVSRERPYARLCGTPELPEDSIECRNNVRFRSFFSGHASLSFASASLLCTNHLMLGLLGGPWDALTCVSAYGVATTTALFRVMGDMHYVSDVTVGALVGTGLGILVPMLHYTHDSKDKGLGTVDIKVAPVGQGFGLVGTF